jgi:hypothetical protein
MSNGWRGENSMSWRRWFATIGGLLLVSLACGLVSFVSPASLRSGVTAAQEAAAAKPAQVGGGAAAGGEREQFDAGVEQEAGVADEAEVQEGAAQKKPAAVVEMPPRPDREPYRTIELAEVDRARQTLRERLRAFTQRIAADPAPVRDGWKRYIQTDLIESALGAAAYDKVADDKIRSRLFSNKAGMEFTPVLALRRAYEEFAELQRAVAEENAAEFVGRLQDEARRRLELFEAGEASYESSEIGKRLAQLRRLKQAPKLVESLDGRYNRENLFLRASRDLVAARVEQDVDESSTVTDSILGVSVFGDARLRGRVTLGMVPSDDRARFELRLDGHALASSTGYRGKITLFSTSTTAVMARKPIDFDELGLRGGAAVAACTTDNSLNDIAARCCLVERIAWKRAQQSQGQAEAIASASAERRIESRMDALANKQLADANGSYQNKVRKPLLRRDGFPQSLNLQTTAEHLLGRSLQRNAAQFAATTDPPPAADGGDLAVRLHESYVRNLAESALGGYTLDAKKLVQLYEENELEVPKELQVTDESTLWSFDFAKQCPIDIRFRGGQLLVTVTCLNIVQFDQMGPEAKPKETRRVKRAMRIKATYKLESVNGAAEFVRQEDDLDVQYVPEPGRPTQSGPEIVVKVFMRRKFNAMLKERFPADFNLPKSWASRGRLVAKDCQPAKEWLSMTWDLVPLPAATNNAAPAAQPAADPAPSSETKPAPEAPEVKPANPESQP